MNDFFLATNQSKNITIGDAQIEIRQFLIKELVQFDFFGSKLKAALNKDFSEENIEKSLIENKLYVLSLCEIVTDYNFESLAKLMSESADQFIALLKDIIEVNSAYFNQKDEKESKQKDRSKKEIESTWFDAFQILIGAGHKHDDILNYSYGSYIGYLKAVAKLRNMNALELACITRTAHHADKRGFDSFTKSMKQSNS